MRAYLEIATIAQIGRELHAKDSLTRYVMLVAASQKLSRFSSEHAAHDQFDSAALLHLLGRVVLLHLAAAGCQLARMGLGGLCLFADSDIGGSCLGDGFGGLSDYRGLKL